MAETIHHLKTTDRYFDAVEDGSKTFEVRLNDRAFQTGDVLVLRRYEDTPIGPRPTIPFREIRKRVTFILQGGQFGIEPRYCVLGLGPIDPSPQPNVVWIEEGIERAARYIEKQRDEYVQEYGMYDGTTGVTEFSNGGEEYLSTLEELIDGIRALATTEGQDNG